MKNHYNLLNKLIKHQIIFTKKAAFTKINESFVIGNRANNINIINFDKNIYNLMQALKVIENILFKGGSVLFVSDSSKKGVFIKHFALKHNQFFICSKWIPGFLSNFEQILPDLHKTSKKIKKKSTFSGRKRKTFYRFYKGIKNLKSLPDLIIVFDLEKNQKVIKEANFRNIPVISFCNLDSDITGVTYPIIGDFNSKKVIFLYLKVLNFIFSLKK